GRGVPDVEDAIREVALKPLLDLYACVANSNTFFRIQEAMQGRHALEDGVLTRLSGCYRSLLQVGASYQPIRPTSAPDPETAVDEAVTSLVKGLRAVERLPFLQLETSQNAPATYRQAVSFYTRGIEERPDRRDLLAAWLVLRPLEATYRSVVGICEQWGLIARAERAFASETRGTGWVSLTKVLLAHGNWWERYADSKAPLTDLAEELFADGDVTIYLGLNEYEGEVWFNRERLEELRWWLFATALVSMDKVPPESQVDRERLIDDVNRLYSLIEELEDAVRGSEYKVGRLLAALGATGE
ncbi:MAG TPA: hypothetical protein VKA06_10250, partial [Spirochaetia bacterium]|nr:hypothetical protein [Spirochaetia bacterium]